VAERLDSEVRARDPDRWLSSRFIPDPQARADVVTLYGFDGELARAGRVTSQPLLAEIRLTWWREALDEIYEGRAVRRHPTAQAMGEVVARRRLPRDPLERTVDAWITDDPAAAAGAMAEVAALLLDPAVDREAANAAGRAWRAGVDPIARRAARRLSAAAFPAVAHAALHGRGDGELARRMRVTWAVLRGRL
jgi:15-cis-phytoene synthase